MTELIVNSGDLLDMDNFPSLLEDIALPESEVRERFTQFRECLERRRANLTEETTALEVSFFLLGRMFHILGYTHSHTEALPGSNSELRVDYTLFGDPQDFQNAIDERGTAPFFREALAMVKSMGWGEAFEPEGEDEEDGGDPVHPAEDLDEILRTTAQQWAVLTNGAIWRLYHRNTVTMLNTFFEINVREAIETNDYETFEIFVNIFSKEALVTDKSGTSAVRRILA